MKKYCVTIVRTGCVFVEAENENDAIDIANHQLTDTVNWSEDWEATDVSEDDSACENLYVSEKAFE
jgi:hypothetical protein